MPYLIDGNNLLGSWGGPRGDDGRAEVVRRVASFCRAKGARATIVFDGHPLRHDMETQTLGGVTIRVPREGQDADDVIRDIVKRAPRAGDLIVVTSDKALYSYVKTLGAKILRAHEWNALARSAAPAAAEAGEKPDRETDVEGWLKRFGGD
jgi:predicted RNA-binding protein with PIN domain